MLDEAEFARVAVVHQRAIEAVKDFREEHPVPLEDVPLRELLMPVCEAYTELTGFPETNANAVMHHRISLYGAPCPIGAL